MQSYYVYENRTRGRARIHKADCGCCNGGRGFMPRSSGVNGRWHGPFDDRAAAYAFTARLPQKEKAACVKCRP